MKGLCKVVLVTAILAVSQVGYGVLIERITIEQTSGVTADFVQADGTLYFAGGASGFMVTEFGNVDFFVDGTVVGEFSYCVDTSSGGLASAEFSAGFLSVHLEGAGGPGQYVDMTVSLRPFYKYNEYEVTETLQKVGVAAGPPCYNVAVNDHVLVHEDGPVRDGVTMQVGVAG